MKTEVVGDEELIRRFQVDPDGTAGRTAAGELLKRYQGRVYLWCWRHVREHELALDLAQDVLLSAWRALPRFVERARFSTWVFAIARNRCISHHRQRKRVREDDVDMDQIAIDAPDPIEELSRKTDEQAVLTAIRDVLDAREQEALWLRAVEGLPVDEITRLLKVDGASGARGLLQTIRRKLRGAMPAVEGGRT